MNRFLLLLAAIALAACGKPAQPKSAEAPVENGAKFKKGQGIALTETMKMAIGLQTAEVAETKVAPSFTVPLHVVTDAAGLQRVAISPEATTASGWLSAAQAVLLQPGQAVELRDDGPGAARASGVIKRLEKAAYQTLGDVEVTVESSAPLPVGTRLAATFRTPAGDAVTAIPRAALLKTAEGNFVYAVNGEFYVRTPVQVGALSEDHAEITDGLYAGDQIVVTPVMSLWMAELQSLRGGKACTCGH